MNTDDNRMDSEKILMSMFMSRSALLQEVRTELSPSVSMISM